MCADKRTFSHPNKKQKFAKQSYMQISLRNKQVEKKLQRSALGLMFYSK